MRKLIYTIIVLSLVVSCFMLIAGTAILYAEKPTHQLYAVHLVEQINEQHHEKKLYQNAIPVKLHSSEIGQFDLMLYNSQFDHIHIQVYDLIGNLLIEETTDQSQIIRKYDLSDSKSRMFVVKVSNGQKSFTTKVTVG